jgi:O-antigen biosynthesis protein
LKEFENETPNLSNNDLIGRELSSYHRCDINLLCSNYEINILNQQYNIPHHKLVYYPFSYENINNDKEMKPFEKRKNVFMLGNFNHEPNLDSFYHMKNVLWEKVKKVLGDGDLELHVYGGLVQKKHLELTDKKNGFIVKGNLKDLNTLEKYSFFFN